jgi:TolB-like protein
LRLTLFGGFSAADADGAEIPLKSQKARALLAYLALPLGKSRSREEIMALLWSDRGETQARASLRQVLTGLRKDLGEEAMAALNITDNAVSLDPSNVTVANTNAGEELLAGFHLHDPAFEEWLRDERLRLEGTAASSDQPAEPALPEKPSIAVLPFVNISGDPEQEYFADGITEDITTELTRFRSLFVIARDSSFHYKDQSPKVLDVGRELGVEYVLEGSVRKAGNRVRITAQLVEAVSGNHIWADRYDRELEDIFAVQDEVTGTIVSTLVGRLEAAGRERAMRKSADDLETYDLVLRADQSLNQGAMADVIQARGLYEQVIERDPGSARAHVGLALTYLAELYSDWTTEPERAGDCALAFAKKAVSLDDLDSLTHQVLADAHMYAHSNFEQAEIEIEKAQKLNPNWYWTFCSQTWLMALTGRADEGIVCADRAFRLNPFAAYDCRIGHFAAAYSARRYDEAVSALRSISAPENQVNALLAACYAQLGLDSEARQAMAEFLTVAAEGIADYPGQDLDRWRRYWARQFPFKNSADLDHLLDGLCKAGLEG